ncbi:MAG: hypothetical protein HXY24_16790 [Rubrivivax sp.]|nr:hypothetical protein [Rubrivivax sp.]
MKVKMFACFMSRQQILMQVLRAGIRQMPRQKENPGNFFWVALFMVLILIGLLAGCSIPFLKPKEPQKAIGSTLKHDPQSATETVKQTTLLVKSLDDFVVGENAEQADLVRVFRQINAETTALLNHALLLGLILIIVFLIGLVAALVSYRYFTRRLVGSSHT